MARIPRPVLPGYPQHVVVRGNDRQDIFLDTDDRIAFKQRLLRATAMHGCSVHAYVLMSNHVHLLMTPETRAALSKVMQVLGRNYVHYFNARHERTGTLFEGRFHATLVDSERYALACYRYIELNPVRAGIVSRAALYPWSSYAFNALGTDDELLTAHPAYEQLADDAGTRRRRYRELLEQPMPPQDLDAIRRVSSAPWVLGSDEFARKIAEQLGFPCRPRPRGGPRRSAKPDPTNGSRDH